MKRELSKRTAPNRGMSTDDCASVALESIANITFLIKK